MKLEVGGRILEMNNKECYINWLVTKVGDKSLAPIVSTSNIADLKGIMEAYVLSPARTFKSFGLKEHNIPQYTAPFGQAAINFLYVSPTGYFGSCMGNNSTKY